ncbi:outer membrane protein OmpK [Endozoicomonas lisbonensis]
MKGNTRINLGDTGFNLFGQIFDISGQGFDEQNRFFGFGYNFVGDNFFFKPFLAGHNTQSTYFNGSNGYVLGWTASYDFSAMNQNFTLFNWHETEFGRDKDYLNVGGKSEKTGHNGALELWWHATDSVTAGLQYRYAENKLGYAESQSGVVYSLKYNF